MGQLLHVKYGVPVLLFDGKGAWGHFSSAYIWCRPWPASDIRAWKLSESIFSKRNHCFWTNRSKRTEGIQEYPTNDFQSRLIQPISYCTCPRRIFQPIYRGVPCANYWKIPHQISALETFPRAGNWNSRVACVGHLSIQREPSNGHLTVPLC